MAKTTKPPAHHTPPERRIARYGWTPDLPDTRDFLYAAPQPILQTLPTSADLRAGCPPVYDQGQVGSCTANAIAAAIEFDRKKQSLSRFMPSRFFIYYNERKIEGSVNQDSGAQIRDGVRVVADQGVCDEKTWPYDASPYPPNPLLAKKPSAAAYAAAKKHQAVQYQRVARDSTQMRGCLASGYPFIFGFTVYSGFESAEVARTGIVPLPPRGDQILGGHAVLAVGYADDEHNFVVRNSWGTGWGIKGYFKMPYAYLLDPNLSDDFWTIRLVK